MAQLRLRRRTRGRHTPGMTTVFVNGSIITINPAQPMVEALAFDDGRIIAVGSKQDVLAAGGADAEVIDLNGRVLLPGFIEAHGHPFFYGETLAPPAVDIRPSAVAGAAVVELIKKTAAERKGTPTFFFGWDTLMHGIAPPDRRQLDEWAPDTPIAIMSSNGHYVYANSAVVDAAGITAETPDPAGGTFGHYDDGTPNGVAAEAPAASLMLAPLQESAVSPVDRFLWSVQQHAAAGYTTATEHALIPAMVPLYEMAAVKAPMLRIRAYEVGTPVNAQDSKNLAGPRPGADVLFAKIGMKLWADGSPFAGDMASESAYLDSDGTRLMGLEPCHHGKMNYDATTLGMLIEAYYAQGWQVAVHTQGEIGARAALDAYEKATSADPVGDRRVRLEHCALLGPEEFVRLQAVGGTPSFFPGHILLWGDAMIDQLFGPEIAARWIPARTALDAGLRISLHNDWITPPDPLSNIEIMVTRKTRGTGRVLGPEQRLTVDEALRAHTIDAAWQLFLEDDIGSLEVGKCADFVILAQDPREVDPDTIHTIDVEATFMGGHQTHGAPLNP